MLGFCGSNLLDFGVALGIKWIGLVGEDNEVVHRIVRVDCRALVRILGVLGWDGVTLIGPGHARKQPFDCLHVMNTTPWCQKRRR